MDYGTEVGSERESGKVYIDTMYREDFNTLQCPIKIPFTELPEVLPISKDPNYPPETTTHTRQRGIKLNFHSITIST